MIKPIFHRKKNRLDEWDYSRDGFYFVTICVKGMKCVFGEVRNGEIYLNRFGEIVENCWRDLPNHYKNCFLDYYRIMPNHAHLIVKIDNEKNNFVGTGLKPVHVAGGDVAGLAIAGPAGFKPVCAVGEDVAGTAGFKPATTEGGGDVARTVGTKLSEIIRGFKTFSSRRINELNNKINFSWQRSFYDRIIRNDDELNKIRQYIMDNPARWDYDKNKNENLFY